MKLNNKQKLLMDLYMRLANVFDQITDELGATDYPGAEKAAMQTQIFCAVLNDFVSTLPTITPGYIKQLVDYVFACRDEYYGPRSEKTPKIEQFPTFGPATSKILN